MPKYKGIKRRRPNTPTAFDNEAVDSESDQSSESNNSNSEQPISDIPEKELNEEEILEAQKRVADRHERNRIFQRTKSQELADSYEIRVANMSTLGHNAVHKTAGSRRSPHSTSHHNLPSATHIEGRLERSFNITHVGLGLPTVADIEARSIQNYTFYARRDFDTGPNGDRIRKENGPCRVAGISRDSDFFRGQIIYSIGNILMESLSNIQIDELLIKQYDKNDPTYIETISEHEYNIVQKYGIFATKIKADWPQIQKVSSKSTAKQGDFLFKINGKDATKMKKKDLEAEFENNKFKSIVTFTAEQKQEEINKNYRIVRTKDHMTDEQRTKKKENDKR